MMKSLLLSLFATALLLAAAATSPAQSKERAIDQRWIAAFEQSYGTEGLYVIELFPRDVGGNARLNLQALSAAAHEFSEKYPKDALGFEALRDRKLMPELLDSPGDQYSYDATKKMFVSSVGKDHSLLFGTALLVDGNRAIRTRLVAPDDFVRGRWKKLYSDPEAPKALKNEIELREFLIGQYAIPEVHSAEQIQQILREIKIAAELYAANHAMLPGDEITVDNLMQAGLLNTMEKLPPEAVVEYRKLGEEPVAMFGQYKITTDAQTVTAIRRKYALEAYQKYGRYPPAMALLARFEDPAKAVRMINEAIKLWPDVPGLRVERLGHEARRRNFAAWDQDLDAIVQNFPAAPLLTEIQIAAEGARLQIDKDFEARIAVTLADIRPDLLTQQLYAIEMLKKTNGLGDAQRIYNRLVFSNPAWQFVVPSPAATMPSSPSSTMDSP
ncbi:hypothetical protein IT570_06900 [Candidatus Sumerlaeota bacterium]|nr:hypothetical protein [Candidatus Sumerlaeota bacterium]